MTNKRKRKRKISQKQKQRNLQKKRTKASYSNYYSKIETINYLISEYFNTFGQKSFEYSNLMTDVEKILGNEHEPFILHGSETRSGKISETLAHTTSRKTKYRITKLNNYLANYKRAPEIVKEQYGFSGNLTRKQKQIIKMRSALKKLQNDALPNFYEATGVIVSYKDRLGLQKEFTKLKGMKRDSIEYRDEYFKIGKLIEEYLEKKTEDGNNQIKRLEDNSVFEEVQPTTLANALRRK